MAAANSSQEDFASLQDSIQKALVAATRTVNRLTAEDLGFQRAVNPDVARQLDDKTARLLGLSTKLLQSAAKTCGVKKAPKLEEAEDIDVRWRSVVDVVDSVLEKADTALDEYTGLVKRKEPPTTSDQASKTKKPKTAAKVIRNANISKPQLAFDVKVDNFPTKPWKPLITSKPHAIEPLEKSLELASSDTQHKHPYETEITQMEYPPRVYQIADPIPSQPDDTTSATWVDTYEGVLSMLTHLKQAKEIAVDLEHHDFRTYTGLVCLMQISTRDQDWIVDTLQPWRHKLEVLNEVFADPGIVKVFHGAYMDMIWLQRDLGLYVNGLFDTYFACEQLYPGRSLAYLLSRFVNFDADKQYQLADWRIRPIPEEMLYYARSDTHYLLYIYDCVRNDLIEGSDRSDPEKDLIGKALQKSKELSLSRHTHPDYNEETGEGSRGWYTYVLNHAHLQFDSEQFTIFKTIWKWRDQTAREEDESTNFVLGTNYINEIAKAKPPDAKALHSLLPPSASLARKKVNDIWALIQTAKAKGGQSLLQFFSSLSPDALDSKRHRRARADVAASTQQGPQIEVSMMDKSQLFGDMPVSSRWESSKRVISDKDDDYIPFPWQKFVNENANGEVLLEELPQVETAPAQPPAAAAEEVEDPDEEFTLKKGKKRKSDAVEEPADTSSEEEEEHEDDYEDVESEGEKVASSGVIAIDDVPGPSRLSKRPKKAKKRGKDKQAMEEEATRREEAKKARRARKLEKRAKSGNGAAASTAPEQKKFEAVPFDYSSAPTVINAKREPGGAGSTGVFPTGGKGKKEKKAAFDPYSKTGEEPIKGARKRMPIKGERSATFRK